MIEPLMYAVKAGYRFVVICSTIQEQQDFLDSARDMMVIGRFRILLNCSTIESDSGGWVRFMSVGIGSTFGGDRLKGLNAEVTFTDSARRYMYERPTVNFERMFLVAAERNQLYRAHLPKEEQP